MINNNRFIKFGIWLGMSLVLFFTGVFKTYALMTTDDVSFLGHTINGTWSTSANGSNSGTTWIIADKPTSYIYIDICSTGETGMSIVNINNSQGNVSYMGSNHMGIRCNVGNSNPELTRHYLKVNNWNQVSSSFDEWNVNFTMTYKSNVSWNVNNLLYAVALGDTGPWTESQDIIDNANQNTQDIINNQNQNNQNIINNQNQNTQNIINNQNQNTDKEIESQKVCSSYNFNGLSNLDGTGFLTPSDTISASNDWYHSNYTKVNSGETYLLNTTRAYSAAYCLYDLSKSLISCTRIDISMPINIVPTQDGYIRYSFFPDNSSYFKGKYCENGNQSLNDSVNNLDNTLKDDNVDDNGIASAFEDFNDFLDDNSTITSLITLPITLYTAILNNVNGTCSPFNLGKLYGEDLILPCINISQYLGSSLWSMIDIIISGFAIFAISKKMIKVFNNFSSLREGDVIDD